MSLLKSAAEILADERRPFGPPHVSKMTSSWTLRDALLTAAGCDRNAGYLAYWEWQEIRDLLERARTTLGRHRDAVGRMDVERWANHGDRTRDEVVAALLAGAESSDLDPPSVVTLRPACDPKVASACRIPFVPLAAVIHAWSATSGTWGDFRRCHELTASMNSWALLSTLDPGNRQVQPPPDLAARAKPLHRALLASTGADSPANWLYRKLEDSTELDELPNAISNGAGDTTAETDLHYVATEKSFDARKSSV